MKHQEKFQIELSHQPAWLKAQAKLISSKGGFLPEIPQADTPVRPRTDVEKFLDPNRTIPADIQDQLVKHARQMNERMRQDSKTVAKKIAEINEGQFKKDNPILWFVNKYFNPLA